MTKTSALQSIMDEHIHVPGAPQFVATRGFVYQWMVDRLGFDPSDRGFGSVDYAVFAAPKTAEPLTDAAFRDSFLNQIEGFLGTEE